MASLQGLFMINTETAPATNRNSIPFRVLTALRGCAEVAAIDMSRAAADNTRRNAERHGVADRVRVSCGARSSRWAGTSAST